MKFRALCVLSLLALFSLAVPCLADSDSWYWAFSAYSDFQDSGMYGGFSIGPNSSDGYDNNDTVIVQGPRVYFGTYHQNSLNGWTGPTGFYGEDSRSSSPFEFGASKTWDFYVWADQTLGVTASRMVLSWQWGSPGLYPLTDYCYHLTLCSKPDGITEGPSIGAVYDLSQGYGTVQLPVYRTDDGRTGYMFKLTATVVPEPSSLAALAFGLLPLGAAAIRRRRR